MDAPDKRASRFAMVVRADECPGSGGVSSLADLRDALFLIRRGRRFDIGSGECSAAATRRARENAPHRFHRFADREDAMTQLPTGRPRRQRGITLLETATAACVSAVLAASALPSMSAALDGHRLTTATNDLVLAVNLARSTATAQRTRVVLAPRSGADWTSGWRVFVDGNNNGQLDAGEAVVREFDAAHKGLSITPHFGTSYSGAYLSFDNIGNVRRLGSGGYVLGR
ncbi:MAG: GspH/FimT family pseudopilin, partial [Pseudomonadota bacterium]